MKAILKATGEVIDVVAQEKVNATGTERVYRFLNNKGECLRFNEIELTYACPIRPTDWEAYRREVAKECAAHLLSTNNPEGGWEIRDIVSMAVETADALINEIKQKS